MPEKIYQKITVVDEDDNVIGAEYMFDAIEKGMIRRAACVLVFNEVGDVLIQQRSAKVLKPLLLDHSAAGHVDEGETYFETAERELCEELGLSNVELTEVATSFRTKGFYRALYRAIVPNNTAITFDPEEVNAVLWMSVGVLEDAIQNTPEKFSPSFIEVWSALKDRLIP